MRSLPVFLSAAALFTIWPAAATASSADNSSRGRELRVVSHVDLSRYLGKWYEIARYPNRFERDCASDVTASYAAQSDGRIEVVNVCSRNDGKQKTARGKAKIVDPATNAKLKVTFFWPFYGDYWIIALGPEYNYAVIGEPGRKYLWILSRTPGLDGALYASIQRQISAAGYDPAKLVMTPQKDVAIARKAER